MRHRFACCLLAVAFASLPFVATAQVAPADTPASPADAIHDEAPVVVSGALPGPGLWKVSKGDHVLWVLGTQSPLPRHMQWQSREVEGILAASQELIYAPALGVTVSAGGFFRSLFLVPKVYGARNNPDGQTLADVLPADLYARWLPLRERYLGRGRKAERMRPVFAADELWSQALDDNELVEGGIIAPVLDRAVKAHGLRETRPSWTLKITDGKALLADIEHAQLNDQQCLVATVQELGAGPDRLRRRANAWAVGDLAALRAVPESGRGSACGEAVLQSAALRKRGSDGMDERMRTLWLDAAEKALADNSSTFALLPISDLLSDQGYVAALAARGYEVIAPQ